MDHTASKAVIRRGSLRRKWPLIGAGLAILCVACWGLFSYLDHSLNEQAREFYCDLIKPGMGRTQVKEALAAMGPYSQVVVDVPPPPTTYIYFDDFFARASVKTVVLIYEGDVLATIGASTGLGDPAELPDCNAAP